MGAPVFKIRDTIRRHGVQLRSSNYELYADLNRRFNAALAEHSDTVEIYSIDETFFHLPALPNGLGDVASAHRVREAISQCVGLPTRVGLGPTRTLSKVANALAKASEKVWGVGGVLAARLWPLGVRSAGDLAATAAPWARSFSNASCGS